MNGDNLHPWIEPELEARLVALVLGEASDFEREELERLVAGNPELAVFKKRIEAVHGLLREVATGESEDDNDNWKLPKERRAEVLSALGEESPEAEETTGVVAATAEKDESAARKIRWISLAKVAAVIFVLGVLATMSMPVYNSVKFGRMDLSSIESTGGQLPKREFWAWNESAEPEIVAVAPTGLHSYGFDPAADKSGATVDSEDLAMVSAVTAPAPATTTPQNSLLAITDTLAALSESIAPAGESGEAELGFTREPEVAMVADSRSFFTGNADQGRGLDAGESRAKLAAVAGHSIPMPELKEETASVLARRNGVVESLPADKRLTTGDTAVSSDREADLEAMEAKSRGSEVRWRGRSAGESNGRNASGADGFANAEGAQREQDAKFNYVMPGATDKAGADHGRVPALGKMPASGALYKMAQKEEALQEEAVSQQPSDLAAYRELIAAKTRAERESEAPVTPPLPGAPAPAPAMKPELQRLAGQLNASRLPSARNGDELAGGMGGGGNVTSFSVEADGEKPPAPTTAPIPALNVQEARIDGNGQIAQSMSGYARLNDDSIEAPSTGLAFSGGNRSEALDVTGGFVMPGEPGQQAGGGGSEAAVSLGSGAAPSSASDSYGVNPAPAVAGTNVAPTEELLREGKPETEALGQRLMEIGDLEGATRELRRDVEKASATPQLTKENLVESEEEEAKAVRELALQTADEKSRSRMLAVINEQWETTAERSLEEQLELKKGLSDAQAPADNGQKMLSYAGRQLEAAGDVAYEREKLKSIVIPEIDFKDVPLEDAIEFLRRKSADLDTMESDPSNKGVNLVVQPAAGPQDVVEEAQGRENSPRITLNLKNVPLEEALRYTTELAGRKYKVDSDGVEIVPLTDVGEDLLTKVYGVPPNFLELAGAYGSPDAPDDPFAAPAEGEAASDLAPRPTAKSTFEELGIEFPPGSSAFYNPETSQIVVRNTQSNMELLDTMFDSLPPPSPETLGDRYDDWGDRDEIRTTVYDVPPDFIRSAAEQTLTYQTDDPFAAPSASPRPASREELAKLTAATTAQDVLEERGIVFPPGASAEFNPVTNQLVVRNSRDNTQLVDVYVESLREDSPITNPPLTPEGEFNAQLERVLETQKVIDKELASLRELDMRNSPDDAEMRAQVGRLLEVHTKYLKRQREILAHLRTRLDRPVEIDTGETQASAEPFSTFSLHVSDVSFKLAQAALAKGEWPEAGKIRIEEFVNAFEYDDPTPNQRDKVACRVEQAIQPFLQQRNLLRIAMRTAAEGRSGATPLRLTFLLDNSGSMERVDRQETVRRAFALLADQLQPIDQVTLISFARQPRLLADKVGGERSRELIDIVANIPSEGGTNLEAALQLAFEKAREQQAGNAQNRIVLLTDGAANLGDAEPESLARLVQSMRDAGIAFDAAGIGADGLNDEILEALTRKGDGRYYLLDRPEDADAGFARQIAGALRPAAKNVKVQVEFNAERVGRYKLLGFEKHRLEKEDFRDDSVDAAEMAAEEAGVAVYQFEPMAGGGGDVGSVSVRFRDMSTGRMVEKLWPIPYEPSAPRPEEAEPSMRIATAAALLAAKLKGEPLGEVVQLSELAGIVSGLPERFEGMERVQDLKQMIDQARQLAGE